MCSACCFFRHYFFLLGGLQGQASARDTKNCCRPTPTILITGGNGYIGSHLAHFLHKRGYSVVVIDLDVGKNRVPGVVYISGDCGNRGLLDSIFCRYAVDTVIHCAALIAVEESTRNPLVFYENNVAKTMTLLHALCDHGVKRFIFSSSCAVYGVPEVLPLTEEHARKPVTPYGKTKLMVEMMLEDLERAHGLRYTSLRYFNVAGALPTYNLGELHDPETHLITLLFRAAQSEDVFVVHDAYPTLDGTCVRDYIHVLDIADAHVRAFEYLYFGGQSVCLNLGSGKGVSVKEVVVAVEKATGKKVNTIFGKPRSGVPARLVAERKKAQEILGWEPRMSDLESMVKSAYEFYCTAGKSVLALPEEPCVYQ